MFTIIFIAILNLTRFLMTASAFNKFDLLLTSKALILLKEEFLSTGIRLLMLWVLFRGGHGVFKFLGLSVFFFIVLLYLFHSLETRAYNFLALFNYLPYRKISYPVPAYLNY